MCRNQFPISTLLLTFSTAFAIPAHAVLTRTDYVSGSADYARYINLANQSRFDTVGAVVMTVAPSSPLPPALSGATFQGTCTGSLISASVVLTAAHCMYLRDPNSGTSVSLFSPSGIVTSGTVGNGTSVLFGGGSTMGATYAGSVDRVSVYPGYNGTYGSGDIALIRVNQWVGATPSNYLSLYTGSAEATVDPAFATTIGYGSLGNGSVGSIGTNPGYQKLAGLTEVDYALNSPNVLSSTFYSNGQRFSLGYPSNFLQAAPAPGDSGGPLVSNSLVTGQNVIIGTVGGGRDETDILGDKSGGNFYGEKNYWVRTSSFSNWINSEVTALGSLPPILVSGGSFSDPLRTVSRSVFSPDPNMIRTEKSFVFLASGGTVYLDPESGLFDDFDVRSGPSVNGFTLPSAVIGLVEVWDYDFNTGVFVDTGARLGAGATYQFSAPTRRFRLIGLGGHATTLGMDFSGLGAVDLLWASTTPVPEPGTYSLLLAGLGLVSGVVVRHRRQKGIC